MRRIAPLLALLLIDAMTSGVAAAECTCRARGQDYPLGQNVCLATPKGARLATCGMVLNNTSWQFSDAPCVVSAAAAPSPERLEAGVARRGG